MYDNVAAIVLIGPPACGKSTLRAILSDYDVASCDLEESHETGDIVDEEWKQTIETVVTAASTRPPRVVVIEGAISGEQIDYINDIVGDVLTVRVEAPENERLEWYVDRESDSEVISESEVTDLRLEGHERHYDEMPYPQHDVIVRNSDNIPVTELSVQMANLVAVMSELSADELTTPKQRGA